MVGLLNVVGLTGVAGEQLSINVPLPRMGKGGYDSDKFKNKPAKDLPCSSLFPDVEGSENLGHDSAQGVPHFAARGNQESPWSVLSIGSWESGCAADEIEPREESSSLRWISTLVLWACT